MFRISVPKIVMCVLLTASLAAHAQPANPEDSPLISPSIYTQDGFAATGYARQFQEWKARFVADREALIEARDAILEGGAADRQAAREAAKAKAFRNSVDGGKKGLSLINFMEEGLYDMSRRGAVPGLTVARLIENEHSQAVGYGGKIDSEGRQVEVFYVVFHDMTQMREAQLASSPSYSVFPSLRLPKLNEAVRMSWPTMLFVRDKKGRLMLYAMTAEQLAIVERTQWKSIY